MRKIINDIFLSLVFLLFLAYIFIFQPQVKQEIAKYQHEIEIMKLEVEQLRLEQQELTKQVRDFVHKWNVTVMEATAYAPADNKSGMCADANPLLTSTGTVPGPGTVAVNPSVIPYGSRLWIQGYGWGKALDTGGMIRARSDLIDLFQWSYDEAMRWGRRKVVVVWSPGQTEY